MRITLARHPGIRLATRSFQARTRSVATMAQGAPVYDIAVKGWPQTNTLGDCEWLDRPAADGGVSWTAGGGRAPLYASGLTRSPLSYQPTIRTCARPGPFCHRALLTLEEKAVPYTKTLIDFDAKPQWLLDVNPAGSVPVMKDLASGEWIVDSGVIVDLLEARFPQPALGTSESAPQV